MKVDKKFTPMSIVLESSEELDFFRELLYAGKQHTISRASTLSMFSRSCYDSPFYKKCDYLERLLK